MTEYLSWLPREKTVERTKGGPGPITLVRTTGSACGDPPNPFLGLQMLIDGGADLTCDVGYGRFQHVFGPGDFVVIPPETESHFDGPGEFVALSLAIPKQHVAQLTRGMDVPPIADWERLFVSAHHDPRVRQLITMLWDELQAATRNGALFVSGLMQSLVAVLLEIAEIDAGHERARLGRRTLQRIQSHVRDSLCQPIETADLAELAHLSPSHFTRVFRESVGLTPSQFVLQVRIDTARDLLQDDSMSLAAVAEASGFYDQSHLTRHFKRSTGTTPAAFRANLRD